MKVINKKNRNTRTEVSVNTDETACFVKNADRNGNPDIESRDRDNSEHSNNEGDEPQRDRP